MNNFILLSILLSAASTAAFVRLIYKEREKDIVRNFNRELLAKSKLSQDKATQPSISLSAKSELDLLKNEYSQLSIIKEDLQKILNDSSQSYPWLSNLFADYFFIQDQATALQIRSNQKTKTAASEFRKQLISENRELRIQLKMHEYQLHFYETLFPWLEDFKELSPQDASVAQSQVSNKNEYDILRNWLSPEEYNSLSSSEKYQLALDRYQLRSKSKWEIGIEYERYIGYLCEQYGYNVSYTGANLGLEDMGRDLILYQNCSYILVQCKRWSLEKTIHEKHIFQLFGSCILFEQQHPECPVFGVFVTSTKLSDTARLCASRLNIQVFENISIDNYPVIKCNISHSGEKIYHLPFDQQYDRVVIEPYKGEFYANTVAEAENAGFRRALRHNPYST